MTSLIEAAMRAGQPVDTLPYPKPHIMICTPCHSGKVDINFHISLALAGGYLAQMGVDYTLDYNVGMSVDWARSQMASSFLKCKDYTHLLFIDDDMAFAADLPYRLLIENLPVVGVPYRRKQREVKYNIRHTARVKIIPGRPYLIGVDSLATGMMMIRRDVLETLSKKTPEFLYDEKGDKGWLFFRHQLVDDEMVGGVSYMGEDYYFCKTVIEDGYDLWAYVDEDVAHIGTYAFDGAYSKWAEQGQQSSFSSDRPRLQKRILVK